MNNIIKSTIVIGIITLMLCVGACDFLHDEDDLNCTQKSLFVLRVNPNTKVYYGLMPTEGADVIMDIYKVYCDGVTTGFFTASTTTDSEGNANFGMYYEYKFKNLEDKIFLKYTIKRQDEIIQTAEHELDYNDANVYPTWSDKDDDITIKLLETSFESDFIIRLDEYY